MTLSAGSDDVQGLTVIKIEISPTVTECPKRKIVITIRHRGAWMTPMRRRHAYPSIPCPCASPPFGHNFIHSYPDGA